MYPLIIFLGGGIGRGDVAFKAVYQELKAAHDLSDYILFVPQAQGMWWEEDVERVFSQLLLRIFKTYSIDTDRVYMAGISNGGMGAFFYATHLPERFAAIATVMGHPVVKHAPPETEEDRELLKNLANTAVYMIHGEKDKTVYPRGDRMAYKMLARLNYRIAYDELPGRSHDISFKESRQKILGWFRKNQRNPHPDKVELVMNYTEYNRSYWIRVDKTNGLPAKVSARITGNTYVIKTKGVRNLTLFLDEELIDFSRDVIVEINGKKVFKGQVLPEVECLLLSAGETVDPRLSYSASLKFEI